LLKIGKGNKSEKKENEKGKKALNDSLQTKDRKKLKKKVWNSLN
jgi:hypothetical protein